LNSGLYGEARIITEGEKQPVEAMSQWVKDHKTEILAFLNAQEQIALIREVLTSNISDRGEIPLPQALIIGHLENSVLIRLNEQQEWVATPSGQWFMTASEKQSPPAIESLWESYGTKPMYSLSEWLIASCKTPLACLKSTLLQMLQRGEVNFRMDSATGQWMPVWPAYEAQQEAA
jgi:hypothetical protein